MMGGSEQTNVIPPEAWANLDVRLLPGGDPKAMLAAVRRVVNDPNVSVEPWKAEFRVANYSGTDNALFAAIREVSAEIFSGDAGGAAHYQWVYGESALPAAGN